MIPGGISELKLSNSRSKVIQLSGKHQGFVRMALKNGTDLVPVYSFGETLAMDHLEVPFVSWATYKFLKMPFPYFVGMGGFWQIPRRVPINVVVGDPIPVPKNPNPSPELVSALHLRYYRALTDLFERHKHSYGHGDYSLQVLYLDQPLERPLETPSETPLDSSDSCPSE